MSYLLPGLALPAAIFPILAPAKYAPFIPLVGWTLALQWFIDEYYSFSAWTMMPRISTNPPPTRLPTGSAGSISHEQRDELLGQWFQNWFHRGGLCAAFFTPLTFSSSLVVLYRHFKTTTSLPTLSSPVTWTAIGLALSVYHIRYGHSQYRPFKRIGMPGNEGNNTRDLTGWVEMHRRRVLFIDVPAWISFVVGTAMSVQA